MSILPVVRLTAIAARAAAGAVVLASASAIAAPPSDGTAAKTRSVPAPSACPETRRVDQVDTYHGVKVTDPYRWLEDLDEAETASWIEAQNGISEPFLEAIPSRQRIQDRLTELWNFERYSLPVKEGGRTFYERNDGLQDQDVLYVADGLDAPPRVLIDPNGLSADRTTSISQYVPSPDGRLLAYSLSEGGSDWRSWRVLEVATGEDLPDRIAGTKFTGASWSRDGSGFYYSRYPLAADGSADDAQQVAAYFHRLGMPQDEDREVFAITDHPTRNPYAEVTDDGRYLTIGVFDGYDSNGFYYRELAGGAAAGGEPPVVRLLDAWDALYDFLGNVGGVFYFSTTHGAPNSRVIAIDLEQPRPASWREVVPEAAEPLESATLVGGYVVAHYLQDAASQVRIFSTAGKLVREVELADLGSVAGFDGKVSDPETFYSLKSFTTPGRIVRYDLATGASSVFREAKVPADLSSVVTEQVFYTSADGTRVPMFLVHRAGMPRDGDNPTMLYGYGGFNVSMTPFYSSLHTVWIEMGGLLAIPNLRGGGEYGESWHLAGTKLQKQNVFDDFIAAAEWLIERRWTRSERLVIRGGSNGGLLVGAAMTQRPELFGAALPAVGVLDMLRYHTASANARQWSSDYGLSEDPREFEALYAYSPYHNLTEGACYPPTLITTADHDNRVVPWHSFKFAAALQRAQSCSDPTLIRVETRAGHGAGRPTWMIIENAADELAFAVWALGMEG